MPNNYFSSIIFFTVFSFTTLFTEKVVAQEFFGGYFNYESSTTDNLLLKQYVKQYDFTETQDAFAVTYLKVKLGLTYAGYATLGILGDNVPEVGIDAGLGLVYGKSVINAYDIYGSDNSEPSIFAPGEPNNQSFFTYYQTGNKAFSKDYGLNLRFDVGTLFYVGAELDAGITRLVFTDTKINDQKIKSNGWFATPRIQGGISLPFPFILDSDWLVNLKMYASYGWDYRTNTMDWIGDGKKFRNFSKITSTGNPYGIGLSLIIGVGL